jgi:hypothetical protein
LSFHQAVGDAGVVALALGVEDPVFVGVLAEVFLGGGELEFAFFTQVIFDEVL